MDVLLALLALLIIGGAMSTLLTTVPLALVWVTSCSIAAPEQISGVAAVAAALLWLPVHVVIGLVTWVLAAVGLFTETWWYVYLVHLNLYILALSMKNSGEGADCYYTTISAFPIDSPDVTPEVAAMYAQVTVERADWAWEASGNTHSPFPRYRDLVANKKKQQS